jgi:O-antigen/teichoic acid export membrane protein
LAIAYLITSGIQLPVTIWMAFEGYGVWALVVQNILGAFIPAIIYFFINRWKPLPYFSKESFKSLFDFGFFMLLASLFSRITENIQGLLIGRLYNPAKMGYYSKAQSTSDLSSRVIIETIAPVTFPLMSQVQDNRTKLINAIRQMNTVLSMVIMPSVALLVLLAKPIFVFLYSEKWLDSVPMFQILCLSGVPKCLNSVLNQSIKTSALGKQFFSWSVIQNVLGLVLIVGGMWIAGINGMLVGMVIKMFASYILASCMVGHYINYSFTEQHRDLMPIILTTLTSYFIAFFMSSLLHLSLYINAICLLVIFCTIFLIIVKVFRVHTFDITYSLLKDFLRKRKINR